MLHKNAQNLKEKNKHKQKPASRHLNTYAHMRADVTCNLCLHIGHIGWLPNTQFTQVTVQGYHVKPTFFNVQQLSHDSTHVHVRNTECSSLKDKQTPRECQQCPVKSRPKLTRTECFPVRAFNYSKKKRNSVH